MLTLQKCCLKYLTIIISKPPIIVHFNIFSRHIRLCTTKSDAQNDNKSKTLPPKQKIEPLRCSALLHCLYLLKCYLSFIVCIYNF